MMQEDRDTQIEQALRDAAGAPPRVNVRRSRQQVRTWFEQTAPLIEWDMMDSPVGPLYVAATVRGVAHVSFGESVEQFLNRLDPLARAEHNPQAVAAVMDQLRAYFEHPFSRFDVAIDLNNLPSFHRAALLCIRQIPAGSVWTYKQVAEKLGRPTASRAVGQAMAHNPVPIVIPCHRVVGSSGALTGYGGSGGIATKQWLLQREGAL